MSWDILGTRALCSSGSAMALSAFSPPSCCITSRVVAENKSDLVKNEPFL